MSGFASYYIEGNVACTIAFGILLIHDCFLTDRQEKQIKYDRVLVVFMCYFIADCFWAAIVEELIPKTRFTASLDAFLIYLFMAGTTYFWLDYIMALEQAPNRNRPINRFAVICPFMISTVAMILHYIISPQAIINDTLDNQSLYYVYLLTVPSIYIIAVLFYAIRRAVAEDNIVVKRRHIYVGILPLLASIGGMIQTVLFPYMPIYCFVCLILMLIYYIQALYDQISLDPLTHLNNRGQLRRYISQRSNLYQEGRLTIVIMMDINKFKSINDTYGHAEGDKALLIIADSLRKAANNRNIPTFICRYGGDEFILIIHPERIEEADRFISQIHNQIAEEVESSGTPFPITVSVGFDTLNGNGDRIQDCIHRADMKLYENKRLTNNLRR